MFDHVHGAPQPRRSRAWKACILLATGTVPPLAWPRVTRAQETIHGMKPGTYLIQAFQDEDDSGGINRPLLGWPEEGLGFSRDAPINFGAPSFASAASGCRPEVGGCRSAFAISTVRRWWSQPKPAATTDAILGRTTDD